MFLFSYGTLMDKEFQSLLFARELKSIDGILYDFKIGIGDDGYFYITQAKGHIVKGKILEIERADLLIADLWEEVPLYQRVECYPINTNGESIPCFVYIKTINLTKENVDDVRDSASVVQVEKMINKEKNIKEIEPIVDNFKNTSINKRANVIQEIILLKNRLKNHL